MRPYLAAVSLQESSLPCPLCVKLSSIMARTLSVSSPEIGGRKLLLYCSEAISCSSQPAGEQPALPALCKAVQHHGPHTERCLPEVFIEDLMFYTATSCAGVAAAYPTIPCPTLPYP